MAKKASFLGIPGELRNEIYDLYVSSMTIQVREGVAVPPALTRVNRQIRAEFTSILQRHTFDTTPVEVEVFNWDMRHVLVSLSKLDGHSNGTTRHLKLNINLTQPGAAYFFQRFEWCQDVRLAALWYYEDQDRWQQLRNNFHSLDCLRVRIGDQFFDIEHNFRFPPSPFSIESRGADFDRARDLPDHFNDPGLQGIRARILNTHLERKLRTAMANAQEARRFIDVYWANHEAWNRELRFIQQQARQEQEWVRETERLIRFRELRRALGLFRCEATAGEWADLQAILFRTGRVAQ